MVNIDGTGQSIIKIKVRTFICHSKSYFLHGKNNAVNIVNRLLFTQLSNNDIFGSILTAAKSSVSSTALRNHNRIVY